MHDYRVETPVAFLVFNRPETTMRVFAQIAAVRPKKLLVVADGPRTKRRGDLEKCVAVRSIIDRVEWDCEVLKNYSEVNLGCKCRISSGLDWVFGTVDRAIVLEDDVLPHPTFFRYCDELLEKYAEDERVGAICGCNFQNGMDTGKYSYYFSRYNHVWGWASWARAWRYYDMRMRLWPEVRDGRYLRSIILDTECLEYWHRAFQTVYAGKLDTWDYQWTFACWANNMLAVLPQVNLVSNIGFGPEATHTTDPSSSVAERPLECLAFPLSHPPMVMRHELADAYTDGEFGWSRNRSQSRADCYLCRLCDVCRVRLRIPQIRHALRLLKAGQLRVLFDKVRKSIGC